MDVGELKNFKKFFENFAGKIGCFKKYCSVACITGGIAEAFYGMPQELRDATLKCLPEDIREEYGGAGKYRFQNTLTSDIKCAILSLKLYGTNQ